MDGELRWRVFTSTGPLYAALYPSAATAPVTKDLASLLGHGLPQPVLDVWASRIQELNGLQVAAINEGGLLAGRNVLVTAPTSSGISGGEPLLLRDLPDLARRVAAGGGTAVSVTTNGWHLARRAGEIAGAVDAVRVSFDGPDQTRHDRLRGDGSFRRAAGGVREAVRVGLPVQLQTVLMSTTRTHAQAVVDLAVALGAGGVTFLQMLPIGAGTALAAEQSLPDEVAQDAVAALDTPTGFRLRLRLRDADAAGFTVVRADGWVWRNDAGAAGIARLHPLREPADLAAATSGAPR